jgi:cycloeucalenol cycloisomerase
MLTENSKPRWFSANPDKAWSEKWFLLYSPIWMAAMGLVMLSGLDEHLGDIANIVLGVCIASPFLLVPALKSPENSHNPWYKTYWFKANSYMAVFGFFGNYFGSEYFFDVLGMVYSYPGISWNLDSALLGSGSQVVPLLMYLLTHAYFMTYHSTAIVVLRRFKTSGIKGMFVLFPVMVGVIGYFWAWMETKAMANPLIEENFYYEKMDIMLAYGSAIYAIYFICSFPIYYFIDEHANKKWTLLQVIAGGLSASMLTFYGLDFTAHFIGSL